jgi:hypothetical protein
MSALNGMTEIVGCRVLLVDVQEVLATGQAKSSEAYRYA